MAHGCDPETFGFWRVGAAVSIYPKARIIDAEQISIGSHVSIDDFVFIQGAGGLRIGSYVQICCFTSITGGGPTEIGDFTTIAPGARILTGTDVPDGSGLINATVPAELRAIERLGIELGAHSYIGANAVVHPGVTIGEGAVVGSHTLVLEDIEPWTVNVGAPSRAIGERPREVILERAQQLLSRS